MKRKIIKYLADSVLFDGNLRIKYIPSLIDSLRVYNYSRKNFTNCERWGTNEEGELGQPYSDFGMIADFHFNISKTDTLLHYGDPPFYGYFWNSQSELILLPVGATGSPECFEKIGRLDFMMKFPVPETMMDLAKYIDTFIEKRAVKFEQMKIAHRESLLKQTTTAASEPCDDLPF